MIDLDDFRPELIYPYDPRYTPQAPPTADVCAAPVVTICMNTEWWAHVSGMITRLAYFDAWTGTEDEKHAAIESIYKILDLGRPNMSCGCGCGGSGLPSRYNSDGVFQISYDGGVTWVDAPDQDPRNNVTLAPPLPGADGNDKKCQAATNIRGHLEHLADQQAADAEAYGEITLLIAAFAALAIFLSGISLGTLTPLLLGVAGAMLTAGQAAFEAAMTTAVFDDLECLLYCNMQPDGTFSDANLAAIKAGIAANNTGMAETWLYGTVNALGKTGLANMGRTGSGLSADCSECDCFDSCAFNWVVREDLTDYMDITEVGEDYIIVNSHTPLSNGVYYANVHSSGGISDCCYFDHYDILSGGVTGIAGVDCGVDAAPVIGLWEGHCVHHLEAQSGVPFVIKYFLTPCP